MTMTDHFVLAAGILLLSSGSVNAFSPIRPAFQTRVSTTTLQDAETNKDIPLLFGTKDSLRSFRIPCRQTHTFLSLSLSLCSRRDRQGNQVGTTDQPAGVGVLRQDVVQE